MYKVRVIAQMSININKPDWLNRAYYKDVDLPIPPAIGMNLVTDDFPFDGDEGRVGWVEVNIETGEITAHVEAVEWDTTDSEPESTREELMSDAHDGFTKAGFLPQTDWKGKIL